MEAANQSRGYAWSQQREQDLVDKPWEAPIGRNQEPRGQVLRGAKLPNPGQDKG